MTISSLSAYQAARSKRIEPLLLSIESAMSMIAGTCRSMGVLVGE